MGTALRPIGAGGVGFRVWGLRGLGFRAEGFRLRVEVFVIKGLGFRIFRARDLGCSVQSRLSSP